MADNAVTLEEFSELVQHVNGLNNHFHERIEVLKRENADMDITLRALKRANTVMEGENLKLKRDNIAIRGRLKQLEEDAQFFEMKAREATNAIRNLMSRQDNLTRLLAPSVADFDNQLSAVIGEADFRAPERLVHRTKKSTAS